MYVIYEREQMLEVTDITDSSIFALEGSLNWWRTTSDSVFFPLSFSSMLLGAVVLLYNFNFLRTSSKMKSNKTSEVSESRGNQTLDCEILKIIAEKQPESIEQLIDFIQEKHNYSKKILLESILHLQTERKITLRETSSTGVTTFSYLFSNKTIWYWLTLLFSLVPLVYVLQFNELDNINIYVRYAVGFVFTVILPGYSFVKALFPSGLERTGRIGLSICFSIALVSLTAFFSNFTPSGLDFSNLFITMLMLILVFATTGLIRGLKLAKNGN